MTYLLWYHVYYVAERSVIYEVEYMIQICSVKLTQKQTQNCSVHLRTAEYILW